MCKPLEINEEESNESMLEQANAKMEMEISKLNEDNTALEYKIGALGDVARLNVAGQIVAAMVMKNMHVSENYINKSVVVADKLVTHYTKLMDKKTEAFHLAIKKLEDERLALEDEQKAAELEKETDIGELTPIEDLEKAPSQEAEH